MQNNSPNVGCEVCDTLSVSVCRLWFDFLVNLILCILVTGLHWRLSPGAAHTAVFPSHRTHRCTTHSEPLPADFSSLKQRAFRKPPMDTHIPPGFGPRSKWKPGNLSSRLSTTRAVFSFARFGTSVVSLTLVSSRDET